MSTAIEDGDAVSPPQPADAAETSQPQPEDPPECSACYREGEYRSIGDHVVVECGGCGSLEEDCPGETCPDEEGEDA